MSIAKKIMVGAAAVTLPLYFLISWLNTVSVNLSGGSVAAWNIFNLI